MTGQSVRTQAGGLVGRGPRVSDPWLRSGVLGEHGVTSRAAVLATYSVLLGNRVPLPKEVVLFRDQLEERE